MQAPTTSSVLAAVLLIDEIFPSRASLRIRARADGRRDFGGCIRRCERRAAQIRQNFGQPCASEADRARHCEMSGAAPLQQAYRLEMAAENGRFQRSQFVLGGIQNACRDVLWLIEILSPGRQSQRQRST